MSNALTRPLARDALLVAGTGRSGAQAPSAADRSSVVSADATRRARALLRRMTSTSPSSRAGCTSRCSSAST